MIVAFVLIYDKIKMSAQCSENFQCALNVHFSAVLYKNFELNTHSIADNW